MQNTEIVSTTREYSRKIREQFCEPEYIYGEQYDDAVCGALLSAVNDMEKRRICKDAAYESSMKAEHAMCMALGRAEEIQNAEKLAEEIGTANAIFKMLKQETTPKVYTEVDSLIKEYADVANAVTLR